MSFLCLGVLLDLLVEILRILDRLIRLLIGGDGGGGWDEGVVILVALPRLAEYGLFGGCGLGS